MIFYKVKLTPDGRTHLLTSPAFPEVTSFGKNREEALEHGLKAIEEALAARMSRRETLPQPAKSGATGTLLALPFNASAKVYLYDEMMKAGLRKSDLARKMKLHRQEIDRLLDLNHPTNAVKIEKALAALGKRLVISLTEAN